jgi:hypothetical protein
MFGVPALDLFVTLSPAILNVVVIAVHPAIALLDNRLTATDTTPDCTGHVLLFTFLVVRCHASCSLYISVPSLSVS